MRSCQVYPLLSTVLILMLSCSPDGSPSDRTPEAEQQSFQFADPDLRISLVAAEPDVVSPVDMAWAPDGSLYVAEMPGYPITENTGRIKKLTDPDGDGRYHLEAVFADDLNFPTSVLPYKGGILVTDAPDLLYLKDNDGDGVADVKEVMITGFNPGNEQLRANSLFWGLDNWIYGANGRSGGSPHFVNASEEPVSIDSRDFRFDPIHGTLEAVSGMSQFGLARDNWGNRFISYNHRFARQVVLEEEHLMRNPSLAIHAVFDTEQNEHDRRVYTLLQNTMRFNRDPIGYFTSLSGLSVYRGNLLGDDYTGDLFAGESVQAAVIHRRMQRSGVTFTAVDTEKSTEFLVSPDDWFHPVNFSDGPDGALYLVDFYRLFVEHPEWAHEDKRQGIDWTLGQNHGRIWRIVHKDAKWDATRLQPNLQEATVEELVSQLRDPAGWRRDMAQQLLVEGEKKEAGPLLERLLNDSNPLARLHALRTLDGLGLLSIAHIERCLKDPVAQLKVQGIQLAERRLVRSDNLIKSLCTLAGSSDHTVRFQAILALGSTDTPLVRSTLIVCATEYKDFWSRVALLSSTAEWAGEFSRKVLRTAVSANLNSTDDLAFFRQIGTMVSAAEADPIAKDWISGLTTAKAKLAIPDMAFLAGYLEGSNSLGKTLPDFTKDFFNQLLVFAQDDDNPSAALIAVALLRYSNSENVHRSLLQLVLDSRSKDQQMAGVKAVTSLNRSDLSDALFGRLQEFDPVIRKELILGALNSVATANSLLSAIENEVVDPAEIPEDIRQALLIHTDQQLQDRAVAIIGKAVNTDRQTLVEQYQAAIQNSTVDLHKGAAIFNTHCSACHAVNGVGGQLAPDLTNIGTRTDEELLVSILDPSRMVSYELRLQVVVSKSGEVFSGTISAETASSITIKQPDGQEKTILRENIRKKTATSQSIMPEGFERMIDQRQMADLIGFLRQPVQVSFLLPSE